MYSVLLMAAMAGPAETPAWGANGGCIGSKFQIRNPSWGCAGCAGYHTGSVHGGGACYGYAFAGLSYGFAGCYGSCYGSYTNYFSYWSQPAQVHYGSGLPAIVPPRVVPAPPKVVPAPVKPVAPPAKAPETRAGLNPAPATVIVSLPADATLYANGVRTSQTSNERHFITPPLEIDRDYHYVFTIEVRRNDVLTKESRQVEVKAGAEVHVAFGGAADPTRVASGK